MKYMACSIVILVFTNVSAFCIGDSNDKYVSRQEYEALKKELDEMKAKLAELTKTSEVQKSEQNQQKQQVETLSQRVVEVESTATEAQLAANEVRIGNTKILISGDAATGFTSPKNGNSSFSAEFSPMFLWQLDERLFFEGGLEASLSGSGEDSSSEVDVGSAYFGYTINDYILAGMGYFAVPFTAYHNHFDPPWINKLPTDPLIYSDDKGIAPDAAIGAFVTGAVPTLEPSFNYAAWITNGPDLITDNADSAGSLDFDNFDDNNNNKAVGARIGWYPVKPLEVGYSFQYSQPGDDDFGNLNSYLHGVDLNFVQEIEEIKGRLTARAAWVWSLLSEATYDPTGQLGFGPLRYDNDRNGGYAELAYRPTKALEETLRNFEFVLRYDRLEVSPDAPDGGTINQWTPGIDYWLTPRTVLKAAYTFDSDNQDAFLVQFATGF